ncbi:MAG: superoxide dismutase family protein [Anaerolineae bacterium]
MKRRALLSRLLGVVFLLIVVPSYLFAQEASPDATIRLLDTNGAVVGFAYLTQGETHVKIDVDVFGLPAGFHGVQIHTLGACDTGDSYFAAAGAVLGADAAQQPDQKGNLPTLLVLADGTGWMSAYTDRFTVADLLDADGSSIIIYSTTENTFGSGVACGALRDVDSIVEAEGNLWAVNRLPLTTLPATIYRGENAEEADITLTLNPLGGAQINGRVEGASAGPIGELSMDGDFLVFSFTNVDYNVYPLALPDGNGIGQQYISLDPAQASTICVNMATGEIQRDFHWLQTASGDVLYNGGSTVGLGDTAHTEVAEVRNLGNGRYMVRMLTNWTSTIELSSWSIGGVELPAGTIDAAADFDGVYILDFHW